MWVLPMRRSAEMTNPWRSRTLQYLAISFVSTHYVLGVSGRPPGLICMALSSRGGNHTCILTYVNISVRIREVDRVRCGEVRRTEPEVGESRVRSAEGGDSVGGNGDARNHACVEAEVRCRFSIRSHLAGALLLAASQRAIMSVPT